MSANLHRNLSLDALRGYSILTMVLSNLAGEILIAPHPIWLRILGSTAAPSFILISGFLIGINHNKNNYQKSYYIKRGLYLLLYSIMIDILLWRSLPMVGMDILYLFGFSTILSAYFVRLEQFWLLSISSVFFLLAPILQYFFGYEIFNLNEFSNNLQSLSFYTILKQWFVSGWFPIFPWFGVFLIGVSFGKTAQIPNIIRLTNEKGIILFGFLFFLGISVWDLEPKMDSRGGYSELFYPPTLSFFLVFISITYFLYVFIENFINYKIFYFLAKLGEFPLLLYILHLIFIIFIYSNILKYNKVEILKFIFIFLILVVILFLTVYLVKKYRNPKWKLPLFLKMLVG